MENIQVSPILAENEVLSFKCLHYSVTESAGTMTVSIIKKNMNMDCTFGVKTLDGTAMAGKEYTPVDEVCTMKKKETEKTISIQIIDNHDWQPDMDFFVEIYDTKNG